MADDRIEHRSPLAILIAGFALLIILLAGSAYVGLGAMRAVEAETVALVQQERDTIRLIDDVQGEEGTLSDMFYSLAMGGNATNRGELLSRLDALEENIHRTTEAGMSSRRAPLWQEIRNAADAFISEGRAAVGSGHAPRPAFYRDHQELIDKVAELASVDFSSRSAAERSETEKAAQRFRYSVALLAGALLVAVLAAVATVIYVNRMVGQLRSQAAELADLSAGNMAEQEALARKFSHELHDQFGQTLTAIEANLVAMQNTQQYHQGRMDDCLGLLKDAMQNVREVSQLLRPAILDDFGLSAALQWLADGMSERTGIPVNTNIDFAQRLVGEQETQLFRIAQEALTNIARHSGASSAELSLLGDRNQLKLTIADNGKGIDGDHHPGRLGLAGMRARARTAGGHLDVDSRPGEGVTITIALQPKLKND